MANTHQNQGQAGKRSQEHATPATNAEHVGTQRFVSPPVDIFENDSELLLVADLPGVAKDDLRVHIDKDQLLVEARRNQETENFVYRRSFVIAQVFAVDKVTAKLDKGVLKVHLPKAEAVKPRQIQVQVG